MIEEGSNQARAWVLELWGLVLTAHLLAKKVELPWAWERGLSGSTSIVIVAYRSQKIIPSLSANDIAANEQNKTSRHDFAINHAF